MSVPHFIKGWSARRIAPGVTAALLLCSSASAAPAGTTVAPQKAILFLAATLTAPTTAARLSEAGERPDIHQTDPIPVSIGYTYRGVAISGRKLDSSERMLQGDVSPHVSLWLASQDIVAEGRLDHKDFKTSGNRYGGMADLYGGKNSSRELTGSFEVFQSGQGKATAGRDYVTYVGTQTETISFALTQRGPHINRQYVAVASRVRGGSESANVLGGGFGLDFPLGGALHGSVNGSLLSEQGDGGSSTHPVFDAGLTYRPVSWARLEAGAVVAPNGFAVAGTALTGLTSFLVYKPGGAAQELAGERAGFGVLRLVITHAF